MLGERSGLRGRVLVLLLACFLCHTGLSYTYLFGPLQADITQELELSRSTYAAVAQTRNYVMALAGPVVGLLLVRFGSRAVLALSVVILSSSAFALSGADGWITLLAGTLILGIGISGVGDIAVGHAVSGWIGRGRGSALGFVYTASNLGGMILVPLISQLSAEHSWREALRYLGGATLLLLLPFAALVREPPAERAATPAADPATSAEAGPAVDLPRAIGTRSFWILVFVHLSYFAYVIAVVEHFISYLLDEGVPRAEAAARWGSAVGLGIASKLFFGLLSDRISARHGLFSLLFLMALSSVLLVLAPQEPYLWLFVVVFGFSYAARDVITPLIIIECFGVRYMAKIYGAIFPTLLVGGGIGSVLAGLCADTFGTYRPVFVGLAAGSLAALCLVPFLRREEP